MHISQFNIYTFIDSFDENKISNFSSNHSIIYRNYEHKIDLKTILQIKKVCKKNKIKFYLANDIKLALQANLDGVYIPSFNKEYYLKKNLKNKNFILAGSAHNIKELKIKERQNVKLVFISPIFKVKKKNSFLSIIKFNNLSKISKKPLIALGGINPKNVNQLNMTRAFGFSGISHIKKIINN